MNVAILAFFSLIIGFALAQLIEWKVNYPVYLIFLITTGLFHSYISSLLVFNEHLEFPSRPFAEVAMNNIIFDFYLLPAFALLLVFYAYKHKRLWISVIGFSLCTRYSQNCMK
jgi:hypothetical protein